MKISSLVTALVILSGSSALHAQVNAIKVWRLDGNVTNIKLVPGGYISSDFNNRTGSVLVEWSFTDTTVPARPILINVKLIADGPATQGNNRRFFDKGNLEVTQTENGVVIVKQLLSNFLGVIFGSTPLPETRVYNADANFSIPPIKGLPERKYKFSIECNKLLSGDVNEDGVVDLTDMGIVKEKMGTTAQTGDANFDGKVDLTDFGLVKSQIGMKPPQ
jgi:hypothetical protein